MVYQIDPLSDPRWNDFVPNHPRANLFHSFGWLKALNQTYGFKPVVLTTSTASESLRNGLVFCRVSSWLTGVRYVSLPFSDHCDVLTSDPQETEVLVTALEESLGRDGRYAELRPLSALPANPVGLKEIARYCFHVLDLGPSREELFQSFHKDSIQRKIRRAGREGITFQEGQSETLLDSFYHLLLITRRRHGVPPPPRVWFKNLITFLGDQLNIRIALSENIPIAAIVTVQFKDTVVYKYGGSDPRFHGLGGVHALLWKTIQKAKSDRLQYLDFGRSDLDNPGLITFKDRWNAKRSQLSYFRYSSRSSRVVGPAWKAQTLKRMFSRMPDQILSVAGKLLYKHVG